MAASGIAQRRAAVAGGDMLLPVPGISDICGNAVGVACALINGAGVNICRTSLADERRNGMVTALKRRCLKRKIMV